MSPTATLQQLHETGLVVDRPALHLTDKGRDWLRALADVETHEITEAGEAAADLVLSTNGLVR